MDNKETAKKVKNKKDGKELEVFEKAYRIHYKDLGYTLAEEVEQNEGHEETDLYHLSEEELKKVTKDKIIQFLKDEDIDFDSQAKKEDLIKIILGDDGQSQ